MLNWNNFEIKPFTQEEDRIFLVNKKGFVRDLFNEPYNYVVDSLMIVGNYYYEASSRVLGAEYREIFMLQVDEQNQVVRFYWKEDLFNRETVFDLWAELPLENKVDYLGLLMIFREECVMQANYHNEKAEEERKKKELDEILK